MRAQNWPPPDLDTVPRRATPIRLSAALLALDSGRELARFVPGDGAWRPLELTANQSVLIAGRVPLGPCSRALEQRECASSRPLVDRACHLVWNAIEFGVRAESAHANAGHHFARHHLARFRSFKLFPMASNGSIGRRTRSSLPA